MNTIIIRLRKFVMPVSYDRIYSTFPFYAIPIIFVLIFINEQYVFAPTFKDIWWLGRSPTAGPEDSEGIVVIYYTYPKKIEPDRTFEIGVTLQNRKDEAVVANWLAFSNVSISLRNHTNPEDIETKSMDAESEVVRPGGNFSHSFLIKAPSEEGLYLPFLQWIAWFGPGTTVLENFQYKSEYYYKETDREWGIITEDELPPIYAYNLRPEKSELDIRIDDPFGKLKPVNLSITGEDKQHDHESISISNGERKIQLPFNITYNIKIDQIIEMVPGQIRANFIGWSDGNISNPRKITMDQNKELFALYKTQYKLNVGSNREILLPDNGSDWYDSGDVANFKADLGPSDLLSYSFDRWTGDISSDLDDIPLGHLTMDGPKVLTANFKQDYQGLSTFAGFALSAGAVTEIIRERRRIKRGLGRMKNSFPSSK